MRNLSELLLRAVQTWPEKDAVTSDGKSLTWRELWDRSDYLKDRLLEGRLERGDVVAIYAPHSPAQAVAIFAVAMAGCAFTVVNPLLKENQVKHQVSDSDAKAMIGSPRFMGAVQAYCRDREVQAIEIQEDGTPAGFSAGTQDKPTSQSSAIPADVANIIYTSGSTGKPKGVVVPHRTLLDGARIVSGYLEIQSKDTLLSVLPFGFDYGLNQLLTAVYQGARIVIQDSLFPQDIVDSLVNEKVTGFASVPSLWPNLLNSRLAEKPEGGFGSLRYVTTAGGKHGQTLLRNLVEFFPETEIIVMYGLTESFRSTYLPFSELFKRPGSIGKAVPEVEILVVNEHGERCGPGEQGELVHRGAFVTYGYLNDLALTQSKFVPVETAGPGCLPEMAVRSGDIVSTDEDGFIYFHGRSDAMIKSRGYRVSPSEVEEVALQFAGLSNAAVFGVDDESYGQAICLAYASYDGEAVEERALRAHLEAGLPTYSVPSRVRHYESLPLTANGKTNYPVLIEAFGSEEPG